MPADTVHAGKTKVAPDGRRGANHKPGRAETAAGPRDNTWIVYHRIRQSILGGAIPPGAEISQVQVATELGVSRGPVREAMRMLQSEGLLEAEINKVGRVSSFSLDDLEQLYGMRIVQEALAIRVSVPRFTQQDFDQLRIYLRQMGELAGRDLDQWRVVHRNFHLALVAHAGERMLRTIRDFHDHSGRYVVLYITGEPRAWSVGAEEHKEIVEACVNRDAALATERLARHLARTALTIVTNAAPEHDPTVVRAALRLATGAEADNRVAGPRRIL